MLLGLVLILLPACALAQSDEDSAHRADRLRTEQLNRRAADNAGARVQSNAAAIDAYRAAQAAYQRDRERWRLRLAACEAGDYRACDGR